MSQDIRIVQLKNFYVFNNLDFNTKSYSYRTFSYFDEITVHPVVEGKTDEVVRSIQGLSGGYQKMQDLFRTKGKNQYRSQQLIMAFTEITEDMTQKKIDTFWETQDKAALFFVTMVNVPLSVDLETAVKHIKSLYTQQDYLIYFSFEYNEIIIFCKANSFRDYVSIVARLNYYYKGEEKTPVLDTITMCGFCKKAQESEAELFDAYLCLGTNSYEELKHAIQKIKTDLNLPDEAIEHRWMLGRNDMCVFLHRTTLKQLCNAYSVCSNKVPWISTFEMSVWVEPDSNLALPAMTSLELNFKAESMEPYRNLHEVFHDEIETLESKYLGLCKKLDIESDPVFIRVLCDIESMATNILTVQLARDLAACLIPQFRDFIHYLTTVCNKIINNSNSDNDGNLKSQLEKTLNIFYLNITTLINSTVHSDRQFIQIPHCGVTAFEMPPKIMAYYNIVAHKLVSVFSEDEDVSYGVMLSPKLVDELEVETMPIGETSEPHHLMSINISEKMLYQPNRTVLILGHEIAHFVGNITRLRSQRQQYIGAYYIYGILVELFIEYQKRLAYSSEEKLCSYYTQNQILQFAKGLSKQLFPISNDKYQLDARRFHVKEQIATLPIQLLENEHCYKQILSGFVFPEHKIPLFYESLKEHLSSRLADFRDTSSQGEERETIFDTRFLRVHGEDVFADTTHKYVLDWMQNRFSDAHWNFDNLVGYLFYEGYADVGMILLYNIKPEKYMDLFVSGRKDDGTELARFRAVVRAMVMEGVWSATDIPAENNYSSSTWEKTLYSVLCGGLSNDTSNEHFKKITEQGYPLDLPLQSLLTDYLKSCISKLKSLFSESEKDKEIHSLREIYSNIDPDKSAYKAISEIRNLEFEQLKKWNIIS